MFLSLCLVHDSKDILKSNYVITAFISIAYSNVMKDKILCWLSGDLTHYFMLHYLQKNYDCELYAILDVTNRVKKFFKQQQIVEFEKLWFFHDHIKTNLQPDFDYLNKIEEKYDVNIWKLAVNERIFYRFYNFHKFTPNEILSIDESACRFFESVFEEVNPKFFITKEPAFHHLVLCHEMCLAKQIITLIPSRPNFNEEVIISQIPNKVDFVSTLDNIKPKGRSFEELQKYVEEQALPKKIDYYNKKFGGTITHKIAAAYDFFIKSDNSNLHDHYNYFGRTKSKVLLYNVQEAIKLRYRQYFIDNNLQKTPDLNVKFIYYPMAMDLERNQLVESPFFNNQTELIRHIVKSLPPGYVLYVKEAPGQQSRQWRSIKEYKDILAIPNVTFFHPSVKNTTFLKNCSLVITIGGTSAIEAAVYKKPSIVFSDKGYCILPSVFRIKEIEMLPKLIKKALLTKVNPADVDKYFTMCKNESVNFGTFELEKRQLDAFFHAGNLIDTEITESHILQFLKDNGESYENLAKKHIEKIMQYNSMQK